LNAPSSSRARDWFDTVEDFRQCCLDAVSLAQSEGAQEFAGQMMNDANTRGLDTFVSERQIKWLSHLADRVTPKRKS